MVKLKSDDPSWELVSNAVKGVYQQWVVKKEGGTVKFLRFDPDVAYPRHQHADRTEWLYVVHGEMITEIGDQIHTLKEGEFATFPLNSQHSLKAGHKGAVVLVAAINESEKHV